MNSSVLIDALQNGVSGWTGNSSAQGRFPQVGPSHFFSFVNVFIWDSAASESVCSQRFGQTLTLLLGSGANGDALPRAARAHPGV